MHVADPPPPSYKAKVFLENNVKDPHYSIFLQRHLLVLLNTCVGEHFGWIGFILKGVIDCGPLFKSGAIWKLAASHLGGSLMSFLPRNSSVHSAAESLSADGLQK